MIFISVLLSVVLAHPFNYLDGSGPFNFDGFKSPEEGAAASQATATTTKTTLNDFDDFGEEDEIESIGSGAAIETVDDEMLQ